MTETIRCETCNKDFKDLEGLAAHNKAKHTELIKKPKRPLPVKKIGNWAIFILILGLLIWGAYGLIKNSASGKTMVDESNLTFEAPNSPIHWHPHLTIMIDGKKEMIPKDIGITSSSHFPIHTHETDGILHMENDRPTKKTVTLGYFFEVWGKKFSKDCIFNYCIDKGALKISVNGKENAEFQNYFMQDKDEILIEYISKEN